MIAVFAPCTASAQTTYTWTGGGSDNNWGTASNWNNGVPASSNQATLSFAGSSGTNSFNNLGNWNLSIGRLEFASGASSFTLSGDNFGFNPYPVGGGEVDQNQIFQNSSATQTIAVGAFSFRYGGSGSSNIHLNAGDLVISTPNFYLDSGGDGFVSTLAIVGDDDTRRTLTFSGTLSEGNASAGSNPELYISDNKRLLVTGGIDLGNNGSVYVPYGLIEFGGSGSLARGTLYLGERGSGGEWSAVALNTAGSSFTATIDADPLSDSATRTMFAGLNTSGTVSYSGTITANRTDPEDRAVIDYAATTGGAVLFNGGYRDIGYETIAINRPDGATTYGGTVILANAAVNGDDEDAAAPGGTALYGGTLQISDFNQLGTDSFEFNASSGDSGTLRYTGGSTTTTKTIWIDNAGITLAAIDVSQAGTTLTWNPSAGTRNQNLTKVGAGTLEFSGPITGAVGNVAVEAGTLVLSATNGYSGGTTVTGGTLQVSAFGSAGGSTSGLGTGSVSIATGGQVTWWLSTGGSHTITNAFSLSGGTLHSEDGSNTFSGAVALVSGTSTIAGRWDDTQTLSGGMSGVGNVVFAKLGSSDRAPTFVLSASGTNTGTVRVTGEGGGNFTKLQLANVNALQDATLDLATGDDGVVEFIAGGTNTYTLGGLQGTRDLGAGSNGLSLGGNNASTNFSGDLTAGSLAKTGTGDLTLAGTNSLSGSVDVSAGGLFVDGSLTTSLVTVFAAAGLGGSGSITGPVNIASGGRLSPGNSIESLTAGATGLAATSTYEYEYDSTTPGSLAAAADLLVVNGNLTIDSGALITFADLAVSPNPFVNDTTIFALINYSGTWNGGLFTFGSTVLTDGSRFVVGGQEWEIDYDRTSSAGLANFTADYLPSSSFVAITAVPEPATYAMALAGIACGGYSMWRRRKRA